MILYVAKQKIIIYEKPTCSTCRVVIKELENAGKELEKVNYYKTPLTEAGLRILLRKMRMKPRELLRTKEDIYKKLRLAKKEVSDSELIHLMIKHPDLMQRPIVVRGSIAILARPIEKLKKIL